MSMITNEHADLAAQIKEPLLARLYGYWLQRKGTRRFPRRADVDPLEFPYVLGNVMLIDVLHAPTRFLVRLHGTEMVRRAKYDLTGKFIDALPISEYRDYVLGRCASLVANGEPSVVHNDRILDGMCHRYEALWLPFSDDGSAVTTLLCALIYEPHGRSAGPLGFGVASRASDRMSAPAMAAPRHVE